MCIIIVYCLEYISLAPNSQYNINMALSKMFTFKTSKIQWLQNIISNQEINFTKIFVAQLWQFKITIITIYN